MSNSKISLALFDFCGTLVSFQTANQYVKFAVKNYATNATKIRHYVYVFLKRCRIIKVLEYLLPKRNIEKRILLWQLKNIKRDVLEQAAAEFYNIAIKPKLIPEAINELSQRIKDGCEVAIVSGGYDIYINFFAKEYNIPLDSIFSNKLVFEDDVFSGHFDVDCMGDVKVKILDNHYLRNNYYVFAYSDSSSDIPMLKWADEAFIISKTPYWIQSNHFNMINY